MKDSKKISIVIPLFNKALYIKRAVRSVLMQSYQDYELIVVNDGSTDHGPEIVKRMKDSRLILFNQDNAGVSAARNRGIEAARGNLIAFLDADDEWYPDFLAMIVRLQDKYPEAGLYATSYQIMTILHRNISPIFKEICSPPWEGIIPSYFRSAALGAPPVWTSAACVPKRILKEIGGFAVGKRMGEDVDLWGRIALRYPIAFNSKNGAVYHHDAGNRACMSFALNEEHPFLETVEAFRRTGGIPEKTNDDVKLYVTRLKLENMRQHVLAGNCGRARKLVAEINDRWTFPVRQLLWGSYFNVITRFVWYLRYPFLH
ncbi:MAG: glycosyltransferase family A protein [Thermodesulfovibrionales bacterium]